MVSRLYFFSFDGCRFKFFRSRHWFTPKWCSLSVYRGEPTLLPKKSAVVETMIRGMGRLPTVLDFYPENWGKDPFWLAHLFNWMAQPSISSQSLASWFFSFGALKWFDTLGGSRFLLFIFGSRSANKIPIGLIIWSLQTWLTVKVYTWRIIPFCKWLITMVSKSPKWGYSMLFPFQMA